VLTEDHSLMNELVRRGKLNREQIESSPYKQYKNAVTRAVGVYGSVEVDTFDFDILPGDRFLLCSDGMYAYVDEDELPKQLADGEVKEVPKKLVELANTGGGHDNITAVVVRIGETSSAELAPRTTEVSLKIEVLKGMQIFRYMSYKELVRISNIAEMIEPATDQVIFSTGQPGDAMYVVISGSVKLAKGETVVAELSRGQHFGEMSLVDRSVRSLTATATEGTRLVAVHRKDFYEIIKREPALATKMLWSFVQVLGQRLRKTTNDLSDALHGDRHGETTETENLSQD
jgi:CRP-like cAMP-binding protein